jgi:sugar/nucleoside kinase (ribokinase family)
VSPAVPADPGGAIALLGPLSRDVYVGRDLVLPGGGALNMAWHWRGLGTPFQLLTRIGSDEPPVFLDFLGRHAIPYEAGSIVEDGISAAIDIVIRPDLQPWMDHFVEGVWATYRSTTAEEARIAAAPHLHLVLVEGAIRELERLGAMGIAGAGSGPFVSADFLGFRHYTLERLAATMRLVDLGFVGWPGAPGDPELDGMRAIAHDLGRLLVVTLGSQGVLVLDGRPGGEDRFVGVTAVPVEGTTVGCGDAFIAWFLDEWRRSGDVGRAVERGKAGGALATRWRRPLPDEAYGTAAIAALRAADEAAQAG